MAEKVCTLTTLYDDHAASLRTFIHRRGVGPATADDITSEVFVAATTILTAHPGAPLRPGWLYTVGRRRLADHFRSVNQHSRVEERLRALAALEPREEEHVIHERSDALNGLPPRQQRALELRYIDGLSVGEVADELAVSYEAAESLLARGRRQARHLHARRRSLQVS